MSDLISREALKERVHEVIFGYKPPRIPKNEAEFIITRFLIDEAPAVDAVEVVRCCDCVYQKDAKVNCKGFIICPVSNMEITDDDDFCSYGERKESEASE